MSVTKRIASISPSLTLAITAKAKAMKAEGKSVIGFGAGEPDFNTPQHIIDAAKAALDAGCTKYTPSSGLPQLRRKIAEKFAAEQGLAYDPSQIIVSSGAKHSIFNAMFALIEEGDEVIIPAPYWLTYPELVKVCGGVSVFVEGHKENHFKVDPADIKKAVTPKTKMLVFNSPSNPTGAVYTREELAALAAMLEQKNAGRTSKIVLIADEPYRELTYGAQVPYLMALYPHTVVCYSFSKSLSLAGERIGYIAVSPQCENAEALFAAVCGAGRAQGYVCAPSLFQRVTAKCLGQSGDIAAYRENRDLLYNALVQDGFTCIPPEGAFYLFMKSPEPDAKAFCERAKKYELLLVPSDSFGVEGYVRISYCVAKETIQNSLPAFQKLAKEYGL